MPILNVKVSQPASATLTQSISETLLELTTRILRKNCGPEDARGYSMFASCARIASMGAFAQVNIGVSRSV